MNFFSKTLIGLVLITPLFGQNIKLMTEIFPPFQYREIVNDELVGISVDIVEAIQKDINDKSPIKVYPWSRGMKILEKKKNSAIFSMLRTKERENKFKWVGPLTKMQLVFFKKKGSPITLKSLEDAKKVHKIGVTKNVANYDILKEQGFKNLDVIKRGVDEKNIKKLVKGRIDLWPALKDAGLYNAKIMGLKGEIVPIDNVVIFEGDLYIAFNKKTDDKIIQTWQKALNKLRKAGKIEKIKEKYQ